VPSVPQSIPDPVTFPSTGTGETVSRNVGSVKVADTVLAASMVSVQTEAVANVAQSPPQPPKVAPPVGVAVRFTVAPLMKMSAQSAGQLIWWMVVLLVTDPLTGPGDTVNGTVPWINVESVNSLVDVPAEVVVIDLTIPICWARNKVKSTV
jgi:hypothetical protein